MLVETIPDYRMVARVRRRGHHEVLLSGEEFGILRPDLAYRSLLLKIEEKVRETNESEKT